MNKNNVFLDLKENYNKLTGSQKNIGQYVLDNYKEIAFMSAIELGEKVGVSDATIIRFARSIGYSGFAELRKQIREGIKNFDPPHKRLSQSVDDLHNDNDLISQVGKKDLKNLEEFLVNFDMDKINQAVDEIYKANIIYLIGAGSSGVLIDFLALHLRRMGFRVLALSEGGVASIEKIIPITENDLLIACSFPRYSKITFGAIDFAKQKAAKILSITDSYFSTMSMNSDIVFSLKIDNSTFFNSYVVPMELCNVLTMSILERNKEKIYVTLKENIQNMEMFREKL
ncbi:MurR/RpiR family transcriptional regulator [Pelosinus baikalensis]|uniref:MurR/RpiR family transcriptional regulator n=1 Tax=Pelosinus baikalensis TaxID=2892015 RepID=A0ABS8HNK7_9FIRM|nr:MurR/RpiR family transcriptional regulator [Pelosinus baikalensis]MCC5464719.1 MurR/RpiR family transcriptional regulator [Pelosinus baikalensis]